LIYTIRRGEIASPEDLTKDGRPEIEHLERRLQPTHPGIMGFYDIEDQRADSEQELHVEIMIELLRRAKAGDDPSAFLALADRSELRVHQLSAEEKEIFKKKSFIDLSCACVKRTFYAGQRLHSFSPF
jgi:hypothetical protein